MGATRQFEKLEALAAKHEQIAQSIRVTLSTLKEAELLAAKAALPGKLKAAVAQQAAGKPAGKKQWAGKGTKQAKRATKERLSAILSIFNGKPITFPAIREQLTAAGLQLPYPKSLAPLVNALVRTGHLKRKKGALVRTDKPFVVVPGAGA